MCALPRGTRKPAVHDFSYVTVVWTVIAAAAGLLGFTHAARWSLDRTARTDLTFAILAFAFVGVAITEIGTMQATTPEAWGRWVKWCHLPLAVLVISIVFFVRQVLGTGRIWLMALLIAMRVLILAINFGSDPNINFDRIDSIDYVAFLGEPVTVVGEAATGRWQALGSIASALLAAFVLDATVTLWRRGGADNRRRALVVGGGLLFFVTVAAVYVQLVIWGVMQLPLLITPCFALTLLAMAYELSRDALRASRLARELDQSHRRLEMAVESARFGLCEWDNRTGAVWATQRALEIFGLSRVHAGDPLQWLAQIHPEDAPNVQSGIQEAMSRNEEFALEFRVRPGDRGVRWIAARGRAELSAGDSRARVRGLVSDVSEQHAAVHETQELRRELAHASRVSVLGQLASSLAHELSQPLGAILRNVEAAELLLQAPQPDIEELQAIVSDIHRDDQRAGDVIDRLRSLLKRSALETQPIALESLIADVTALLRADALSRHVTIACSVQAGMRPIVADRVHLSQVLINLIINAMDAVIDEEASRRRVTVTARSADARTVELTVRDFGPGVPEGQLGHIFEPFFTTKAAGMGMGLSICRTIVHAHGGSLAAGNDPSGGAVFTVRLPIAPELPA
jgi:two-component system sensor kinase FixL